MQGWIALFGPALINPFGLTQVNFPYGFLWDCARGAVQVI